MRETPPCMGCEKRTPGCHGSCDGYKTWLDGYHAQQEHFKQNRYRFVIPTSVAREAVRRKTTWKEVR